MQIVQTIDAVGLKETADSIGFCPIGGQMADGTWWGDVTINHMGLIIRTRSVVRHAGEADRTRRVLPPSVKSIT